MQSQRRFDAFRLTQSGNSLKSCKHAEEEEGHQT